MSDFSDDLSVHSWMIEEYDAEKCARELEWRDGYHTTSDDREIKITEMTEQHILNVMRYFNDHDTSPLDQEIKNRKFKK